MIYINTFTHKIVNSVNAIPNKKISLDYAVSDSLTFGLLDKDGKRLTIDSNASYYLVGDTDFSPSDSPCFFSDTYTIDTIANTITFSIDTYTTQYFSKITSKDSSMWLEMAVKGATETRYKVLLQDECLAQPRVYTDITPLPTVIPTYYSKSEIDTLLEGIDTALEGKADSENVYTKNESDTLLSGKENTGTSYSKSESDTLLANKADVGDSYTKTEEDTLLSAKADSADVDTALEGKLDKAVDGDGNSYLANDNTYKVFKNSIYNNGLEYPVTVSGLSIAFTINNTIYSISPSAGNVYTFDVTNLPANIIYTCELWITLSSVISFTLPALTWIDGITPDLSATGTYWIALRYYNGVWYASQIKGV